ncbi:dipeptide ABC transporter ATP-binding protein [Mesorhizobium sp. RP14(2022)]|uniref:Dipeptide ABC transporter ATP-binding protein n=1 Tax=Mesorhizobium liriopis TaxID=2953882 RepID=A0ABT1C6K1_9HYPH|nr:dipeptide ABC transporter ATP-binding protein [Mesorhizobium liriopis]MCO6050108.1 dipeptide ABC transporter ATP-binding protein [Mesorhizobium liriopis]
MSLLALQNLSVTIDGKPILRGIDLSVESGRTVALVGESGSGKSMTALSVMRLLPRNAAASGTITLSGIDLMHATERQMCTLRGGRVGMVFQEPMTALNPVKTIGEQIAEGIRIHLRSTFREAQDRAAGMLDRVGLPGMLHRYPHELSGGQRQRVDIAIACAAEPELLIADEPTSALDVVIQKQILDLLQNLASERGMGLLLISHDLAVVADRADEIVVLKDGAVVEHGKTIDTLRTPAHPYTLELTRASSRLPARPRRHEAALSPLLETRNLTRDYVERRTSWLTPRQPFRAVDSASLSIEPGQSVALVGRSGCGKSTLARMILGLDRPTSGEILFEGKPLHLEDRQGLNEARRAMQVVFQDPYGSFDPRQTVEKLVAEPLHLLPQRLGKAERHERVAEALAQVGLSAESLSRYPHEFSGGQRQRLAIARAIILRPKLIIADEPVSALDVSIRARILELFADLNARLGVAYLFITHDLQVARAVADEVLVMDNGHIVERGPPSNVFDRPQTEPAKALVAATPDLGRTLAQHSAI